MGCGASAEKAGDAAAGGEKKKEEAVTGDSAAGAAVAATGKQECGSGVRAPRKDKSGKVKRNQGANRTEPRKIDWSCAEPDKWEFIEKEFSGSMHYSKEPVFEQQTGAIEDGLQMLKDDSISFVGIFYQTSMTDWPADQQQYTMVRRTKSGFGVTEEPGGGFTFIRAKYQALAPDVEIEPDGATNALTYHEAELPAPLLPGRGQGVADVPMIKIMGDVDPNDISQGGVGDCWLLSAISAMAEYDGAIHRLFRNSDDIASKPCEEPNTYTVTLYDLKTWEPVDIVMDESLCSNEHGDSLLGCSPTITGELWVCYLEKAVAIHCGGWDKIDGGQCTHAWRLLTGCKKQYTFRCGDDGNWGCFGAYNPNDGKWEDLANSPHDGFKGLWPMVWPELGGGGELQSTVDGEDFFNRMCEWDDENYIMGCGTKSGSDSNDTDGIVDGHAYTILACESNAGGTDWDLVKVRNPWGKGEFKSGQWDDDGPGWDEFPSVKEVCKPVKADDGVFWVSKQEFFEYFKTVYLCAKDMSKRADADSRIRGHRKDKGGKVKRNEAANRTEPRQVDWSCAEPDKWEFPEKEFAGSMHYSKEPVFEQQTGAIEEGLQSLKDDPLSFVGIFYQTSMTEWPADQQQYTMVRRTKSGFGVTEEPGGGFTFIRAKYQALAPDVEIEPDGATNALTYHEAALPKPLLPGRGQGVADVPMIKIMGDVDPNDISQGGVGDCWLLSAISAMAEYDGAIHRLFRNSEDVASKPSEEPNTYTVTLYDLNSWEPVDIVMDESLCSNEHGDSLLGCSPTVTGELWVCYLEKAVAIHCGGWDKIDGGQCTHAWRLLTGCKKQYTFRDGGDGSWGCFGAYNPNDDKWEDLANSPHDGFKGLWPMVWPDVGGGGDLQSTVEGDDFFLRMCAWDDENYIMGCGTKSGSDSNDTDGIVDGHAYTILACESNAGGTEWDLVKVRNPWGKGEFKSGQWDDDGPGWDEFPAAKEACNPVKADDGVFWVSKQEFFEYFKTVYLCARDMSQFD